MRSSLAALPWVHTPLFVARVLVARSGKVAPLAGLKENIPAAQKVLQEKAENNGLASLGKYAGTGESSERLFVANYSY